MATRQRRARAEVGRVGDLLVKQLEGNSKLFDNGSTFSWERYVENIEFTLR